MRWSSQGDTAEEKQRSSDEEEPEEMHSRGDQDEAVHKRPRADEDKECPGLDHQGQNKKETRRPGLERPGRDKQQGPPAPGLEHLRTSGGQTPRTGAFHREQGAGAAASWTGTSWDKRRLIASDGNVGHREIEKRPRGRGSGDAAKRSGG